MALNFNSLYLLRGYARSKLKAAAKNVVQLKEPCLIHTHTQCIVWEESKNTQMDKKKRNARNQTISKKSKVCVYSNRKEERKTIKLNYHSTFG
jgi:23S rRNA maturation mini-RNase III